MDNQAKQYNHPTVLRWNISDDYYKDGMTLYADGLLEINVGGYVHGKSLKGWFELANTPMNPDRSDKMERDASKTTETPFNLRIAELEKALAAYREEAARMWANHEWASGSYEEALFQVDRRVQKALSQNVCPPTVDKSEGFADGFESAFIRGQRMRIEELEKALAEAQAREEDLRSLLRDACEALRVKGVTVCGYDEMIEKSRK